MGLGPQHAEGRAGACACRAADERSQPSSQHQQQHQQRVGQRRGPAGGPATGPAAAASRPQALHGARPSRCMQGKGKQQPGRVRRRAVVAPVALTMAIQQAATLPKVQQLVQSHSRQLDHVHVGAILTKLVGFSQSDALLWFPPAAQAARQQAAAQQRQRLAALAQRRALAARRAAAAAHEHDGTSWDVEVGHVSDGADESDDDDGFSGGRDDNGSGRPRSPPRLDETGPASGAPGRGGQVAVADMQRRVSALGASTSSSINGSNGSDSGIAEGLGVARAQQEAARQLRVLVEQVAKMACDRRMAGLSIHSAAVALDSLAKLRYSDRARVRGLLEATMPLVAALAATEPPPEQEQHAAAEEESRVAAAAAAAAAASPQQALQPADLSQGGGSPLALLAVSAPETTLQVDPSSLPTEGSLDLPEELQAVPTAAAALLGRMQALQAATNEPAGDKPAVGVVAALAQGGASSQQLCAGQTAADGQQNGGPPEEDELQQRRRAELERQRDAVRAVVAVLSACCALGVVPPPGWLPAAEAATRPRLRLLPAPELLALLHGFQQLNHQADPAWLAAACGASASLLSDCQPGQVSQLIASFSGMRFLPDDAWVERFADATAPALSGFSADHLTATLASLAAVSCKPCDAWMAAFYVAVDALPLQGNTVLSAEQLTAVVGALARLGCRPDSTWLNECLMRSRRCLPSASAGHLASIIQGLAALRFRASEVWLQHFLSAAFARLPFASPQQCCRMVLALAKLGQKPQLLWLDELAGRVKGRLGLFTADQLSDMVASMARLGFAPDRDWMREFERCSSGKLAQFSSGRLAEMVWAMAEMGHHPQASWLYSYVLAAYTRLDSFTAAELSTVFEALPLIAPHPGWVDELVQICAAERVPAMRGKGAPSREEAEADAPRPLQEACSGTGQGATNGNSAATAPPRQAEAVLACDGSDGAAALGRTRPPPRLQQLSDEEAALLMGAFADELPVPPTDHAAQVSSFWVRKQWTHAAFC